MPRPSVSAITTVSFSKVTEVWVAALTFFQGQDEQEQQGKDLRVLMLHALGDSLRTQDKNVTKAPQNQKKKVTSVNFSMIHSVHEPQVFAGKPLKQLKSYKETSEVKILFMNFISRLARIHKLFLSHCAQVSFCSSTKRRNQTLLFALPTSLHLVVPETTEVLLRTTPPILSWQELWGSHDRRKQCPERGNSSMTDNLPEDLAQYKIHSWPLLELWFSSSENWILRYHRRNSRVSLQRSQ